MIFFNYFFCYCRKNLCNRNGLHNKSRTYKFEGNFSNATKLCMAYYYHDLFNDSRKNHNWYVAEMSEEYFGFRNTKKYKSLELYSNKHCGNCGQKHFFTQSKEFQKKCCQPIMDDRMSALEPLTPEIKNVLLSNDYQHLLKFATYYNNSLCFCSTGVENDSGKGGFEHNFRGNHAVTVRGRTYHNIIEQHSKKPTSAIGYLFFDELIKPNETISDVINELYLQNFASDLILNNPLAEEIDFIGRQYNSYKDRMTFNGNYMTSDKIQDFVVGVNNNSNFFDIGLLRMDAIGERVVSFINKSSQGKTIPLYSCMRHPLSYPMLFPNGEYGWGNDNPNLQHGCIRMPQFVSCRLLHLEDIKLPSLLNPSIKFKTNRFETMSRLSQVMVVDDVSTMIDTKLKFTANNQDIITAGYRSDVQQEDVGKIFLTITCCNDIFIIGCKF